MLFAMSSEEYLMVESIILRWCFITPIGRCEWMSRMSIVEICAYSARTTAEGNVLSATPCRYCCPSSDHLQAKTNGPYFSSQAASLFHGSAAAISCFVPPPLFNPLSLFRFRSRHIIGHQCKCASTSHSL